MVRKVRKTPLAPQRCVMFASDRFALSVRQFNTVFDIVRQCLPEQPTPLRQNEDMVRKVRNTHLWHLSSLRCFVSHTIARSVRQCPTEKASPSAEGRGYVLQSAQHTLSTSEVNDDCASLDTVGHCRSLPNTVRANPSRAEGGREALQGAQQLSCAR